MAALFACTRCHTRVPFNELSQSEQLCKSCRGGLSLGKCTYCRGEFQQSEKSGLSSICKKCAQNVKVYGKPRACEYCSVIAAFIGQRCQRCSNYEKKWGLPVNCEQCKQRCAFDKSEETKKKTDGKVLCYLCMQSYRRVLAKASRLLSGVGAGSGGESQNNTPLSNNGSTGIPTSQKEGSGKSKSNTDQKSSSHHHHRHHHHHHKKDHHGRHHKHHGNSHHHKHHDKSHHKKKHDDTGGEEEGSQNSSKKPKLDKSTSNGLAGAQKNASLETSLLDLTSTDHMVAMTQLREEVESLKKQLQMKEQALLEKDRKLTELKAQNYEAEKELRNKLQSAQKDHSATTEALNIKIRDLQKQLKSSTKGKS